MKKGLRLDLLNDTHSAERQTIFPDEEGIKTSCADDLIVSRQTIFPDEEGIKTFGLFDDCSDCAKPYSLMKKGLRLEIGIGAQGALSQTIFPDEEGIKTKRPARYHPVN